MSAITVTLKGKHFKNDVAAHLLSEFLEALHSVAVTSAEMDGLKTLSPTEIGTLDALSRWVTKTPQISGGSNLRITLEAIPAE